MRAQERAADADGARFAQSARRAQRFSLVGQIEAVTRLDLDSCYALGDQRVEARQGLLNQFLLAGRAQRLDGRDYTAARLRNLLIARAAQPHFELARPIAGMDEMGVTINQPRRDPSAFAADRLGACMQIRRHVGFRTSVNDAPAPRRNGAVLDNSEARQTRGERREARARPDASDGVWSGDGHEVQARSCGVTLICIYI